MRLESTFPEVERVADLPAQLRRRVKQLLLFPRQQVLTIGRVLVICPVLLLSVSRSAHLGRGSAAPILAILPPIHLQFLLLMVEEAAEDGIAGEDSARAHRLIHTLRHLEHAVTVARVNDHVEDVSVGQT